MSVFFVALVDLGTEFHIKLAMRLKWSLSWEIARYAGIICAILLALDVLF